MATKKEPPQPTGGASPPTPEALPADGFSRWNDLKPFIGCSREWVRLREQAGRFPKRVHLSQRCVIWPNRELHRFFANPAGYRAAEDC